MNLQGIDRTGNNSRSRNSLGLTTARNPKPLGFYKGAIDAQVRSGNIDLLAPGVAQLNLPDDNTTVTVRHITLFEGLTRQGAPYHPGYEHILAILLAAYHFNNRIATVVPQLANLVGEKSCDIRFSVEVVDTEFNPLFACRRLLEDVLPRKELKKEFEPIIADHIVEAMKYPTGIVGAARSAVSSPLAVLAGIHNLTQVSYTSAAQSLDNKSKYPYFGRTIVGVSGISKVTAEFYASLGATHVFCVYIRDVFGIDFYAAFVQYAAELGITTESASLASISECQECQDHDMNAALDVLQSSGYRYVFAIVDVIKFMPIALERGLAGNEYFWLFPDTTPQQSLEPDDPVLRATHGSALVRFAEDDLLQSNQAYLEEWRTTMTTPEALALLSDILPPAVRNVTEWDKFTVPSFPDNTLFTYDSFMALALAACDAADKEGSAIFGTDTFHSSFLESNFQGATKVVRFDKKTGTRSAETMAFGISNYLAGSPPNENGMVELHREPAYTYVLAEDGLSAIWKPLNNAFVYGDNTTTQPSVLPHINVAIHEIESWSTAVGLIVSAIVVTASLSFALWVQWHKDLPPIRATQPFFVWMLTIGTAMMGLALVPNGTLPLVAYPDVACNSVPWLLSMGHTVSFAALYSKLMRFHEIYSSSQQMLRVKIEPKHVLKPFLTLLSLNLITLIAWSMQSPLHYDAQPQEDYDRFGRHTSFIVSCSSDDAVYYRIILGLIDITALAIAVFQSYKIRNIKMQYDENRYIFLGLLISSQSYLIGVPGVLAVVGNPSAEYFCRSIAVLWGCLGLLLPICVPKTQQLKEWRKEQVSKEVEKAARLKRSTAFFESVRKASLPLQDSAKSDSREALETKNSPHMG